MRASDTAVPTFVYLLLFVLGMMAYVILPAILAGAILGQYEHFGEAVLTGMLAIALSLTIRLVALAIGAQGEEE